MNINLYHHAYTANQGGPVCYDAETQRQFSMNGRSFIRPAATEATTITLPFTELEVEYLMDTLS